RIGYVLVQYAVVPIVLGMKYRRTRDSGLIWLIVATVLWPLISRSLNIFLSTLLRRQMNGQPGRILEWFKAGGISIGSFAESFLAFEKLVGAALLFTAVLL